MKFTDLMREMVRGTDRDAAREADAKESAQEQAVRCERHDARIAAFAGHGLVMGSTATSNGGSRLVTIPQRVARGLSAHIVGATGCGKTTALTALTMQDVATPGVVLIAADYKGDLATNLAEVVVPSVALARGPAEGATLLGGLRVWAPWSSRRIPSLHVTAPGGSVSRRALALTDLFVATVGAGELGVRQLSVFLPCVKLMMRTGVPFALLTEVLTNEGFRTALLQVADDPELDAYFATRFAADAREGVIYSLLARADRFTADETTKLALFGPHAFDASAWLESGTTIFNFGGSLRLHRVFWASLVQHALLEAAMARQCRRTSPRVVIRIDEVQLGLPTATQADELDDAISLLRSRRVSITIAHQHAGQLAAYPSLLSSLRTNVGMTAAFRVPEETASATSCVLPDGLPPGVDGRGLSEAQIRDAWLRVLGALPDRTFLLRAPTLAASGIAVRAPTLDIDALRERVPEEVRALGREGQDGCKRDELAGREATWRRAVLSLAQAATPNGDALLRLSATDDVTAERPRRRRRAEAA